MKCNYCDTELPDFPKEVVERSGGEISEVVSHSIREKDEGSWASTLTDYYCNPKCFKKAVEEGLVNEQ